VRINLPESLNCVRTVLGAPLDVSLGRPDNLVVYLFISFPITPISSQFDIWAESYDRNTIGRPDGLTERPDDQLQPPFQNSAESFHIKAASGRLHFCCTTCLTKDSVRMGTPHRSDGLQLSSHICVWDRNPIAYRTLNGVWTVLPRRPDECTWTLDSSRTLNSVRTIFHYVWTDAIFNSSKFLDTDGCPDGKFSSSGRMLLTDERPDENTTSFERFLGIRLLWVGICTESSLNTEIAFMKLVTLATLS